MNAVPRLLGRDAEFDQVTALLDAAIRGVGGALVVTGEPGIGKTALLRAVAEARRPGTVRFLRAAGSQFEAELAYATLHQLLSPLLPRLTELESPYRKALSVALGLGEGPPPDRYRVGVALLAWLTIVGDARPVACIVDDAQWMDHASAQALGFVARRLETGHVGLLLAARDTVAVPELAELEELALTGVDEHAARALLTAEIRAPLDPRVRAQIVAEARGNPLALRELPRVVGPAGLGVDVQMPLTGLIERGFQARFDRLSAAARTLLVVASAEPLGDPALLSAASASLRLDGDATALAAQSGLIEVSVRVRFSHPLARSAVYRAASPDMRRRAHRALAAVTDVALEPDRRAWHLALATVGTDAEVAVELERAAWRAAARGGVAAAAAFLERAVALSPVGEDRASRALVAADAAYLAAMPGSAADLLEVAEVGPLDGVQQARAKVLRARLAIHEGRGRDAVSMLLEAATALDPVDRDAATDTFLEAFGFALFAGRTAEQPYLKQVAAAVDHRPGATGPAPARPIELLLEASTRQIEFGQVNAHETMHAAVDAFSSPAADDERHMAWRWLTCSVATDLWNERAWRLLATEQAEHARSNGALAALPTALHYLSLAHLHAGDFAGAQTLIDEAAAVQTAGGRAGLSCADLARRAWSGDREHTEQLIAESRAIAVRRGEGRTLTAIDLAEALLNNGLGRYEIALQAAQRAADLDEPGFLAFIAPEHIEAAVRSGKIELARASARRLVERTSKIDSAWARGIVSRCRALVAEDEHAEEFFEHALAELDRAAGDLNLARTRLLYGEWLRRAGRRRAARDQLRAAFEQLTKIGAAGFAQRAARELAATGERARSRGLDPSDGLTIQEKAVARLVAAGATSKEAAAELVLSPRTIDAHLRSIFRKLGISSRRQLGDLGTRREWAGSD
jgi:DNA-binding CsgD family transcriptional regulator